MRTEEFEALPGGVSEWQRSEWNTRNHPMYEYRKAMEPQHVWVWGNVSREPVLVDGTIAEVRYLNSRGEAALQPSWIVFTRAEPRKFEFPSFSVFNEDARDVQNLYALTRRDLLLKVLDLKLAERKDLMERMEPIIEDLRRLNVMIQEENNGQP